VSGCGGGERRVLCGVGGHPYLGARVAAREVCLGAAAAHSSPGQAGETLSLQLAACESPFRNVCCWTRRRTVPSAAVLLLFGRGPGLVPSRGSCRRGDTPCVCLCDFWSPLKARHSRSVVANGHGRLVPLLAVACFAVGGTAATSLGDAIESPLARIRAPRELRVVSYYPADAAWTKMWTDWRPEVVAADLERVASLHANTVRAVVQPGLFGYPILHRRTPRGCASSFRSRQMRASTSS
jgi:hypothetical protein